MERYIPKPVCDICGKYKGVGSDHRECSKQRQALNAEKHAKRRKPKARTPDKLYDHLKLRGAV